MAVSAEVLPRRNHPDRQMFSHRIIFYEDPVSQTLTVTELVRNFADYVNRVAYRGERFRLTRGGKPVAELGPVAAGRSLTQLPDLVAGLPPLSEKEAESFRRDLEQARIELADVAMQDRWTS